MSAIYYNVDNENVDASAINAAADILNKGGLAVFPTETVYGIGADAFNENAVSALYERKQRSYDKPLLMHISSLEMAEEIAYLDDNARELIKRFSPGPLTLVVKRKPCVPSVAVSGGETVGLRFPSNKIFLEISKAFGKPIAATSANISGFESAKDSSELDAVKEIADVIVAGGACELGLESTIVSLVGERPKILRLGSFPKEKIEEVLGKCD
ncbi:MAG: threonylcarbamoyl-AMP synthase [Clostridia bacterium]|nr:threonylcarbamoyl-AMP synthase [Clostridia bacterium]